MVKGMLKRVCLQCESKGARRSSSSTLSNNRERGKGREAEGTSGGWLLSLKAAGILGRSGGKGKWLDLNARKCLLNWPARASRKGKGSGRPRRGSRRHQIGRGRGGGEEERKVKGAANRWGRVVSERKKKEKEMAALGCRGGRVNGLLGHRAER
jgi:hypothetical protein